METVPKNIIEGSLGSISEIFWGFIISAKFKSGSFAYLTFTILFIKFFISSLICDSVSFAKSIRLID